MKNVPDELHEEVRRRAADSGRTVRDYVIALIARDQRRPTLEEWLSEVAGDEPVEMAESPAEVVRATRAESQRRLGARGGEAHGDGGR